MESVFCINVATFAGALTRGKQYTVLEKDDEKMQLKIKGDNDHVRWYPSYCFTKNNEDLIKIKTIIFDDKIGNPYFDSIEITLVMIQGVKEIRRWCYFMTPSYIYKMFNDPELVPFT